MKKTTPATSPDAGGEGRIEDTRAEAMTSSAEPSSARGIRRQLTMFVPLPHAVAIEAVRREVDPVQSRLIPAHVTLCREDELASISEQELGARLDEARGGPLVLRFGAPRVFGGHGQLLECVEGQEAFDALRHLVLRSPGIAGRRAHITLAHPRNPRAPGNSLERAAALRDLPPIRFDTISHIQQSGDEPWRILRATRLT
jgi:hypothetical protein